MKLYWIRVDPKSNGFLQLEEKDIQRHRREGENGGRDGSGSPTGQGMPRVSRQPAEARREAWN